MEKHPELPKNCILCGTNLKLPTYKCKNCNEYIDEKEIIMDKGNKARCPLCTLPLMFTAMISIAIKSKKNGREIKKRGGLEPNKRPKTRVLEWIIIL